MSELTKLPPQQLSYSMKTKDWRKKHLDWADSKTFFNYSLTRKSVLHKKINYDLLNGKVHINDMELVLNPDSVRAGFMPDKIQHYPIMNSKLNALIGEELDRPFEYRLVITNPNAISEIEDHKKQEIMQRLQALIPQNLPQDQYNQELDKLNSYYTYEWQDIREIRGNAILNHYSKELNFPLLFNKGFTDALAVAEEIYQCDIRGGEPVIERVNPMKCRIFKSGYSNKVEDADIIVLEDYWSPGKIVDIYYDVLSKDDVTYIENINNYSSGTQDGTDNYDERSNFISSVNVDTNYSGEAYFDPLTLFGDAAISNHNYYDGLGNVRVLRVYWKSRRKIKKVKSYNKDTGEEEFTFYPETYTINKDAGEEETIFWINEAWEGTKIGRQVYVNMRPRIVQYNRLSNPSRCHFGIVGTVYNLNEAKPFSLVDMMKPYNYLYDAVHDRLNKAIAANWGKILKLDLAKVPKGWDIEKWIYFAKINHLAVEDSFKEGNIGAATGKLSGAMNNASNGVIDAETGSYIQQNITLLEYIKNEMGEVVGISKQREGQIANRETVGGVERATLNSSNITEWLFLTHDDVKKRALECFLETAKIALRGRSMKFNYILSDMSMQVMEIDGDDFAEADYGLVVDNTRGTQQLNQKLDMLAQAALQNQVLSFSAIMKLYSSCSLAEKQRFIEKDEQQMQANKDKQMQANIQQSQIQADSIAKTKQLEVEQRDQENIRDNQTKVLVAQIQASSKAQPNEPAPQEVSPKEQATLNEQIRQFNAKMELDKKKLNFEQTKHEDDVILAKSKLSKQSKQSSK